MKRYHLIVLIGILLCLVLLPARNDRPTGELSDGHGEKYRERRTETNRIDVSPLPFIRFTTSSESDVRLQEKNTSAPYYIPGYFPTVSSRDSDPIYISRDPLNNKPEHRAGTTENSKLARIDGLKILSVNFDNDIYSNTDYYYTNGVRISLVHPFLSQLPVSRMLLPDLNYSTSYYGIELVQNIYTPIDPDQPGVQYGDRPFASYLYIGIFRTQIQPFSRIRLNSSLNLGILGPGALGSQVQSTIHDIQPLGWQNQVSNEMIVNYNIDLEKSLFETKRLMISGLAAARLGTLYTDIRAGAVFRAGAGLYHYDLYSPLQSRDKKISWYFEGQVDARLSIYDATLQGGMFNPTSIYTIPGDEMSRLVFHTALGFGASWRMMSISVKQHYLSPEFKSGKKHMWGRIAIDFMF